jgi:hypothetical protein
LTIPIFWSNFNRTFPQESSYAFYL